MTAEDLQEILLSFHLNLDCHEGQFGIYLFNCRITCIFWDFLLKREFLVGFFNFCTSCKQRYYLCSRLFFQGCWYSEQPWKIEKQRSGMLTIQYNKGNGLPLEQSTDTLTAYCKRFRFPKVRVPVLCSTHWVCRHPSGPYPSGLYLNSVRIGSKENWHEYAEVHALCCAMSNKVLCLWPRSLLSSGSIHKNIAG